MFFKIKILFLLLALSVSAHQVKDGYPHYGDKKKPVKLNQYPLIEGKVTHIQVIGQGVAPPFATSPAQAYALAKRAAKADAYRLIAEKIKGIKIDGNDTVENMMIKRSDIRTKVSAMVKNAVIVETTYKESLCEVTMEIDVNIENF